jgi:hypothetical protein
MVDKVKKEIWFPSPVEKTVVVEITTCDGPGGDSCPKCDGVGFLATVVDVK